MSDGPSSWILELRDRFSEPAPRALATDGERRLCLVPLYVEGGQIWVRAFRGDASDAAGFVSAPIEGPQGSVEAAREAASLQDLDEAELLELGALDHVRAPTGEVLEPRVVAAPPPDPDTPPTGLAALPLVAARTPRLIEERSLVVDGEEIWVRIAPHRPGEARRHRRGHPPEPARAHLRRLNRRRRSGTIPPHHVEGEPP